MKRKKQPVIGFNEEAHLYTVAEKVVPSVTTIINFQKESFYLDNGAKERGTIVHKLLEEHDLGLDTEWLYGDEYAAFLQYYKDFLIDFRPDFFGVECPVYHERLNYCGTIDRVGTIDGKPFIADIKTGSSVPAWASLQTAAYAMAYFEDYKQVNRFVIHVNPNKLRAYKLCVYQDSNDFTEWEWMCKHYHKTNQEMEEFLRGELE